ncbi:ATP-binding protein [Marinagarivorans algicola]|uniref:ATP-binding protein n=1 Tax=Marinagarivorans algicola TaxID=1513270 RepID=UPI0006B55AE6|nr:ATP-binding protein [Marinagarivorans algicola]
MNKENVYSVFTPTTPARLTFVERDDVNTKLVNALRIPGKQIVVYGHSGSGKSTLLLNKLHQLYEIHLTSRCMKGILLEDLIIDAFDQLAPYYNSEKSEASKTTISAEISQDYLSIKTQIRKSNTNEAGSKSIRVLPPQLTPQALGRFIGQAKSCWVLEDFHKIDEKERARLSQIMKVFMDMADEYPALKIIAIGAVDTARQVVEYDSEMRNRVAEIHVPMMKINEIENIISKGGELLKIEFDQNLIKGIGVYSNGLASICHHLCLNICTTSDIYESLDEKITINSESLNRALSLYLDESSDTLKKAFDMAFKQEIVKKYDNNKLILNALSELPPDGATALEIFDVIKRYEQTYPRGNLTRFIGKLCTEKEISVIRFDNVSGKYSFSDPIYRAFAQFYFKENRLKKSGDNIAFEIFFEHFRNNLNKGLTIKLVDL